NCSAITQVRKQAFQAANRLVSKKSPRTTGAERCQIVGSRELGEWTARRISDEWYSNASRCGDGTVSFGPAVAVELPHVSHFLDLVQVHVCHHHLILVAAAHGEHLSARIAEIGLAVKLADGPGLFDANAIDDANEVLVGHGMG